MDLGPIDRGRMDQGTTDLAETAWAKVNLFLHVVGRRDDGYHLLDSLVVFAGEGDRLTGSGAADLSLALTGPFGPGLAPEPDNLVLRAARSLATASGVAAGARLVLEKNLPIASGIGGGSSDAAAALRLLTRLWDIAPQSVDLAALASRLGADVPVCLAQRPARMGGIGEVLSEVPALPTCGLMLVNPGVAVATPAVFKARDGAFSLPAELPRTWPNARALAGWLAGTRNDLEPPARRLAPVIGTVLDEIGRRPGCLLARMSGSGATCFGLFATAEAAAAAAATLARPDWWVWGGALAGLPEPPATP